MDKKRVRGVDPRGVPGVEAMERYKMRVERLYRRYWKWE
jgi:hypothetical protein